MLGKIKRFFLMRILKKSEVIENYYLMKWYQCKNDEVLLFNMKLQANSVVFDVGAYKGDFTLKNYY